MKSSLRRETCEVNISILPQMSLLSSTNINLFIQRKREISNTFSVLTKLFGRFLCVIFFLKKHLRGESRIVFKVFLRHWNIDAG